MAACIVLNLVALLAAAVWALWLRPRPLSVAPLTLYCLHVLFIQTWVLLSGLAGTLSMSAWLVIGCAVMVVLVGCVSVQHRELSEELGIWWSRAARTCRGLGRWRVVLMVGGLGAAVEVIALAAWCAGPVAEDVVGYYLLAPTDWVATGRIADADWLDSRAWRPQGHGLLGVWWMVLGGSLRAGMLAGVHWLVILWAAMWALVRRTDRRLGSAWTAVLLVLAVPIVWAQSVGGMNDIAVASLGLASLALLAGARTSWPQIALAAVAMLMALGVKPVALLILPPIALLAAWRLWQMRPRRTPPRRIVLAATVLIAFSAAGGWYARNALVWGNPLYPTAVRVGDDTWLHGDQTFARTEGHLNPAQLKTNIVDLLTDGMWDGAGFSDGQSMGGSGFGMAAVLGWPAMIGLLIGVRRARSVILAALGMWLMLSAGVAADLFSGRFFMILALVLIASAAMIGWRLRPGVTRGLWRVMLITSVAWSVGIGVYHLMPRAGWGYWYIHGLGPVPPQWMLRSSGRAYLLDGLQHVPADVTLVVIAPDGRSPTAYLHGPAVSRPLIYAADVPDAAKLERWQRDGAQYLCVSASMQQRRAIDAALMKLGVRRLAEGVYAIP